jgi:hypothetical protein
MQVCPLGYLQLQAHSSCFRALGKVSQHRYVFMQQLVLRETTSKPRQMPFIKLKTV